MKAKLISILYFIFVFSSSLNAQSIFTPDLKTTIDGTGWKGKFTAAELAKKILQMQL